MPILLVPFMKRIFWLMLFAVLAIPAAAQKDKPPPKPNEPPLQTSTVKGRVVYDDTGDPVRRSPVMLVVLPDRSQYSSATGRDGKFEITNVPAGVYFIVVDSPGIITPYAFMKFVKDGPPETLNIKDIKEYCTQIAVDGTNDVQVTVRARRGGAISGKITYSDGSPAVNASVGALVRKGNQTIRVLTGANAGAFLSLTTDDRGRYRIAALPPGEYLVTAAERNTAPGRRGHGSYDELFISDALSASFYGNGTKLADAVAVKVELGSELTNIDITLTDATPHTISGSVIGRSNGRGLVGARLTIRNKEQADTVFRSEQGMGTDADGQWFATEVPDGTYVIHVEPPYEDPYQRRSSETSEEDTGQKSERPKRKYLSKDIEVTVAGSDVAGLAIELVEGGSVSGIVEMPPGGRSDDAYVMIRYAYQGKGARSYSPYDGVMEKDKTFKMEPVQPGRIYLRAEASFGVSNPDGPTRYYVKSITHNGIDLMEKPLVVEAGQQITNVRIVLSAETATADVQLNDAHGKPLPARPVLIVSTSPSSWSFTDRRASDVSDVNGLVKFEGPPGEYLVLVGGPDEAWPPSIDSISSRQATASRIKLKPGDNKVITITVDR